MLKVVAGILAVVAIVGVVWILLAGNHAPDRTASDQKAMGATERQAAAAEAAPPASGETTPPPSGKADLQSGAAPAGGGSPLETARNAEKGSLKSPYADYASVAEDGHKKFMAAGCNGCHGGGGGGGMGPPLTNQVWVYGKDDDTLFRVIALGSDELQKQGYSRKGSENVVGPMPPMGEIVKSDDDMWKIIAWIRSVNPSSAGSSASAAPQ
jgi:mono/diheme cytochrome c family protein